MTFMLLGFPFFLMSQELRMNSTIGYASGEKNEYKKLMLSAGGSICYEFPSHKPIYATAALGWGNLIFNTTDADNNNYYVKIKYAFLPVSFRKYYIMSGTKSLFLELGILNSYYYQELRESLKPVIKEKIPIKILHAGFTGGAGYKQLINSYAGFELAVFAQEDLLQLYNTGKGKLRVVKKIICLTAFRKFR